MRKSCLSYPVEFVDDVFGASAALADLFRRATESDAPRVMIVADMNVVQRHEGLGTRIGRYLQDHAISLAGRPVVIAGGEKVKADDLASVLRVAGAAVEARLGAGDCILALGGGSLLDVAGYAAAQIGGVGVVRVPTSPAAMMDAAFAERAAVDLRGVKDALSVAALPAAVLIDLAFADTVLDGVWRGGAGEAARQAVGDAALRKQILPLAEPYRNRDLEALGKLVRATVAARQKSGGTDVAQTLAGALESMSGFKLPHGYSIPIALAVELRYRQEMDLVEQKVADALIGFLGTCGSLDGLAHSRHLLGRTADLLAAAGPGVDAAAFERAIKSVVSFPA